MVQVYVDSYAGGLVESGDIIRSKCAIKAELGEVIAGSKTGRQNSKSITIYKSLGLAVQDLAAAKLISDISKSSDTELPIPQIKVAEIKAANDERNVDVTSVTTACKSGFLTFTSNAHFNPSCNFVCCEISVVNNVDGSECSSVCFLYNATNGKLVTIIRDWDCNATKDTKMKLLSSMSSM